VRTHSKLAAAAAALVASGVVSSAVGASAQGAPANWPAYNRTLAGDRYSPLAQIDRANVSRLKRLCAYTLPEVTAFQTGPLVVDGTMYFTTDENSYAIDAGNCRLKWRRHRHSATPNPLHVNRGFAYLDGRLFRGTSDGHVLALDAASGRVLWDRVIPAHGPGVSIPMAPIAADGRVYVGNAGGDNAGVIGHVYAYDARDGHLLWSFDVVPPGRARASWTNPRLPITGGAFWTSFTLDRARGILYVPAGNPAPDFDSLERTGADLYSDSVIALDASTGRMLAYRQLVERDSHDWDVNTAPTLVTTRSGRRIIASANKDGLLSILDRSGLTRSLGDSAGPAVIPLLSQTPTTTRANVDVPLSRDFAVHFCPGFQGGVEWNGAAYSPRTDSLFVAAVDWCVNVRLVRKLQVPKPGTLWFGAADSPTGLFDPEDRARGWVSAFDAETGAVRWRFQAPHPMLAGVTPTAGGVVFVADLGGTIYALDQSTGRVAWRESTGEALGGGIVAYSARGRERIAVAAGMKSPIWPGAADRSRILVYGLR
jgi:PQQ-dependent dehydrogenase (methanol/ethanol family)